MGAGVRRDGALTASWSGCRQAPPPARLFPATAVPGYAGRRRLPLLVTRLVTHLVTHLVTPLFTPLVTLLVTLLLLPASAFAQCDSRRPEPFAAFFETFGRDKAFAVSRTAYPLRMLNYHDAENAQGFDITGTLIQQAEDAAEPALAADARAHGLQLYASSVAARTATVRMEKPDTDWLLIYHFVRKGRCWYLDRIENLSL